MTSASKVWKWTSTLLTALVAGLFLSGCSKTFHVETTIPAPPDKVWAVLMDTGAYGEWNPVFTKVEGSYVVGQTVTSTVLTPEGEALTIEATVDEVVENTRLRQSGGIPGLLTFDHQWLLEEVDGGTKVTQHEVDEGVYMWFWDSSWIEPSYRKASEALKERVLSTAE